MSSMQSQDSGSVRDVKQKLDDEIRAGNITWQSIANSDLEGQLYQKIWSIVAKDGKFVAKLQWVFTTSQQGQQRYQHLKSTYSSLSSLHTFVRGVVGVIADSNADVAAEFVAVLTGSHVTGGTGSSRSGQGRPNSRRESMDQPPGRQSLRSSSRDFYYDPNQGIDPRQTLINPIPQSRSSISNADPYAIPELGGNDDFMQDDDGDNHERRRRPMGTGRPFETWAPS